MAEKIRVLLVEPMEKPRLVTIEHTLENLQKLVGGYIQATYPWDGIQAALVCDDEGKFKDYPANRMLTDENGEPYNVVCGSFFICGLSRDNFASITDEHAAMFTDLFRWPEMFMRTMDGHVVWIRMKPGEQPRVIA